MAYLYRHIRLDKNVPFYIGIGTADEKYARAYNKDRRSGYWKNIVNKTKYSVEIMLDDLSWEEACEKEKEFIQLYGRKDLETGTLVNMTSGGEGVVGQVRDEKYRKKLSDAKKGIKLKPLSKEHKEKMSKALTGQKRSAEFCEKRTGKNHFFFGKHHTEETKRKISLAGTGQKRHFTQKHMDNLIIAARKRKYKTVICPHCQASGAGPNMNRYHFDKCKKYVKL
jgi:hypothetical protein